MTGVHCPATGQQIWFGPRGPDTHPVGAADWDQLFSSSSDWKRLASHLNVFGISAGYVLKVTNDQLSKAARDLESRHISLSIGLQSIARVPSETCGNHEGYGQVLDSIHVVEKLRSLKVKLSSIEFDEPIWFGHYSSDPGTCHRSASDVADRVAALVQPYITAFPDITIGDIEPIPALLTQNDWKSTFLTFVKHFREVTGKQIVFLHTDVSWRVPDMQENLRALMDFAHSMHMRFGVIYNGDGADSTNFAWVADAIGHFEQTEADGSILPDDALFETWDKFPERIFPITDTSALGFTVESYLRPRAQINAHYSGGHLTGQVYTASANPVQYARLQILAAGRRPEDTELYHVTSGVIPPTARSAILGLRINSECYCSGFNDIVIGKITLEELQSNWKTAAWFDPYNEALGRMNQLWSGLHVTSKNLTKNSRVHLSVPAGQAFGFNSQPFQVTPTRPFRMTVSLGSPTATGLFGAVIVIWLNDRGEGIGRSYITLSPDDDKRPIGIAITDANGHFNYTIPSPNDTPITYVVLDGNSAHRAADAAIRKRPLDVGHN